MEGTDKKATATIQRSAVVEACRGCRVQSSDNEYLWSGGCVLASFQEKVVHDLHLRGPKGAGCVDVREGGGREGCRGRMESQGKVFLDIPLGGNMASLGNCR